MPTRRRPARKASPRRRSTALYAFVVSHVGTAPLVMLRMPEFSVAWRTIVREVNSIMQTHGVRARDIAAIEGYAVMPDEPLHETAESERIRRGLEAAFDGDVTRYREFWLYAWDDQRQTFALARRPNPVRQKTG